MKYSLIFVGSAAIAIVGVFIQAAPLPVAVIQKRSSIFDTSLAARNPVRASSTAEDDQHNEDHLVARVDPNTYLGKILSFVSDQASKIGLIGKHDPSQHTKQLSEEDLEKLWSQKLIDGRLRYDDPDGTLTAGARLLRSSKAMVLSSHTLADLKRSFSDSGVKRFDFQHVENFGVKSPNDLHVASFPTTLQRTLSDFGKAKSRTLRTQARRMGLNDVPKAEHRDGFPLTEHKSKTSDTLEAFWRRGRMWAETRLRNKLKRMRTSRERDENAAVELNYNSRRIAMARAVDHERNVSRIRQDGQKAGTPVPEWGEWGVSPIKRIRDAHLKDENGWE